MSTEPQQHPVYQGFFIIPTIDGVAVSRDLTLINTSTGSILKPVIKNHGYHAVTFKQRVDGVKVEKQLLLHRLIALAFIPIPESLSKLGLRLQVNHKDGNKLNNSPDNLEWCLPKHNMQHAYRNKLISLGVSVLARDVRSNAVREFPSVASCAREFDIRAINLKRHLDSAASGRRTKKWHVFKYDDNSPWPEIKAVENCEDSWGMNSVVVGTLENDARAFIFDSLKDFCAITDNDYIALKNHRSRYGSRRPFGGWVLEEFASLSDVNGKVIRSLKDSRRYSKDNRIFRVTDLTTGDVKQAIGTYELSKVTGYSEARLIVCLREGKKLQTHEITLVDNKQTGITLPKV